MIRLLERSCAPKDLSEYVISRNSRLQIENHIIEVITLYRNSTGFRGVNLTHLKIYYRLNNQ